MAIRRLPGALPPALTPERQALVAQHHTIAVRLAAYYKKKRPPGLTGTDLFSAAEEALSIALALADTADDGLESYLWTRVRGALKDLIRKTAKELRRTSAGPADAQTERFLRGASAGLDDYAHALQDPGDLFHDTPSDALTHFINTADEAAAALSMSGEEGIELHLDGLRSRSELREHVSALSPPLATVMEMRFFEECTLDEIVARTGLSLPTVTRRIGTAITLLRARLTPKG